jgi:transcriptional regulator with XRE-family HTH domain
MSSTTAETVAANVRAEMARRRVTQADLAELLNVSQQAISRRVSGRTAFGLDDLAKLADHFGVPLVALIGTGVAA